MEGVFIPDGGFAPDLKTEKIFQFPLQQLEHDTLEQLRNQGIQATSVLVAVSGGVDSLTLVVVLWRLQKLLNLELAVAHIHHGGSHDKNSYRLRARNFVQNVARKLELSCVTNDPPSGLEGPSSEAKLREFRYAQLEKMRRERGAEWVALAHTADDLLETRLMRLMRGVGSEGLQSMKLAESPYLRPFLTVDKGSLTRYARALELNWLDDPSNIEQDPLRNWLRNTWLPQLEEHKPGALKAMGRSLEHLSCLAAQESAAWKNCLQDSGGIDRCCFMELTQNEKKQLLAHYLRVSGLQNYGSSHVAELLKRLDTAQKEFTFRLLKRTWRVDEKAIQIESSRRQSD